MFNKLKQLFGASASSTEVVLRTEETFEWHRGTCLQAVEDSMLAFPGELIREGELIGSIIDAGDDAEIGFKQREDQSFEIIYLRLRAGHNVTLQRSAQVILVADAPLERRFRIVGGKSQKREQ